MKTCGSPVVQLPDYQITQLRISSYKDECVKWAQVNSEEQTMSEGIRPFKIHVSDADLEDLKKRLRATRWPDPQTVPDWSQGIPLEYAQKICEYWARDYDWRRIEARLNALPQFPTDLDGVGIYFLHVRSPQSDAAPLILTHGWPGSVIEFLKVIPALTDPARHGGESQDAFHVLCPALPRSSFSDKPKQRSGAVEKIAGASRELMLPLGNQRSYAQGGDWCASVTTAIALQDT